MGSVAIKILSNSILKRIINNLHDNKINICSDRTFGLNSVKKMMIESLIRRGDFCWHCHTGVTAYPVKLAIEKNIPLILYGEPSAEYSSFYGYDDFEELTVEKFNRSVNLGINAEDIMGMINERFPDDKIDSKDIEPWIFPDQRTLNVKKIKATYLGNYIPWDVRKQVDIIKEELEVILTNEEVEEIFDLDLAALLDEMMNEEEMRTAKGNVTQAARKKHATVGKDKFPIFDKKSAEAAIDLRGHAPEADRAKIINKAAKFAPAAAKKAREADKKKD